MSTPAAATGSDSPKVRDDTTRFLCGAAHHDEEFTDSAIREYLMEATRSIPRSPGVNVGVVLREAVAARTRRKVRDSVLLVLALALLFAGSGMLLAVWLLLAAAVVLTGVTRPPLGERAQRASPHVRAPLVLGTAAGMIAPLFVLSKFTDELYTSDRYSSSSYEEYEPGSGGGAPVVAITAISSNIATAGKARTGTVKISTAKESR